MSAATRQPFAAPVPEGFSDLEDFQRRLPEIERARSEAERLATWGAMLMLEAALAAHPLVADVQARGDHEGGYMMDMRVKGADGELCGSNDLLIALYSAKDKQANPEWDRPVPKGFEGLSPEPIESAERALSTAFDFWLSRAPDFFYQALSDGEPRVGVGSASELAALRHAGAGRGDRGSLARRHAPGPHPWICPAHLNLRFAKAGSPTSGVYSTPPPATPSGARFLTEPNAWRGPRARRAL